MTTAVLLLAVGAALGWGAATIRSGIRTDRAALDLVHLQTQVSELRTVNGRLSRRCGHCGAARLPGTE